MAARYLCHAGRDSTVLRISMAAWGKFWTCRARIATTDADPSRK
jgi:hypothetical protein